MAENNDHQKTKRIFELLKKYCSKASLMKEAGDKQLRKDIDQMMWLQQLSQQKNQMNQFFQQNNQLGVYQQKTLQNIRQTIQGIEKQLVKHRNYITNDQFKPIEDEFIKQYKIALAIRFSVVGIILSIVYQILSYLAVEGILFVVACIVCLVLIVFLWFQPWFRYKPQEMAQKRMIQNKDKVIKLSHYKPY